MDSTDNPISLSPPDPQIAVGPSHVVEFVNITGRITDKSGTLAVADFSLSSFFLVTAGNFNTDPKVIYDDIADRFFASYISVDGGGDGFLHLAISTSSDPTAPWNIYFTGPFTKSIPDYPGIGLTDDKFTISYNLFDTNTLGFIGEQTLVVQKSDVIAGATASSSIFPINIGRFTVRPAHSLSSVSDQYLTTFDVSAAFPPTAMTVIRITGTPDAANVAEASAVNLPIILQDSPPPSVTSGPGVIDSGDFRALEAVWRANSLWSSASAACIPPGDSTARSCAHLIEVSTSGAPIVVQDIMFGASGQYYSWPAIRTDSSANLYVSFTGTHAGMFASAQISGRLASDAPNTMSGSCLLKAGEIVHLTERWGDYLGAAVDPANPSTVWVIGQFAKNDGDVRWGTFIGSVSYIKGGTCPQKSPPPTSAPTPAPCSTNDGFEAGLVDSNVIPCWTVVEQAGSSGSWCNQTGNTPPQGTCAGSGVTVAAPPQGAQAAMTNMSGPGSRVLYRCDVLSSATISFQLYINNQAGTFISPPTLDYTAGANQQFRADLVTKAGIQADPFTVAGGDILLNLYQTMPGDPAISGYSLESGNAGAFIGQNVCLRFAVADNQFFFHAGVDDVQFNTTPKATPTPCPPGGCPTPTPTPTPTPCPDFDGDTLCDVDDPDDDNDGCTDVKELEPKSLAAAGGGRNPKDFWDFFDTWATGSRTGNIDGFDIGDVVLRFGTVSDPPLTKEEAFAEALTPPGDQTSYHAASDRDSPDPEGNVWNLGPPTGNIDGFDIGGVVVQFGHTCL